MMDYSISPLLRQRIEVDEMGCAHSHSGQDRIRADMGPQEIWSKLKRLKLQVCSIL